MNFDYGLPGRCLLAHNWPGQHSCLSGSLVKDRQVGKVTRVGNESLRMTMEISICAGLVLRHHL